ncbi:MAG: helix-turn-helix domain-containing protein [Candidatus Acidiferrales bacterium]
MNAGSYLRQVRERLGLTYRDVERASYGLASQRGQPEFIIHLSRLADIENRDVTPSLYKVYSLAAIYHLDPRELCKQYDVPLENHFADGSRLAAPNTHLAAPPGSARVPLRFDPSFDPRRTEYLSRMVERWGELEATLLDREGRFRYGYVGLDDHMMQPLLRPGSLVLLDPALQQVRNSGWNNEYERPIYFIDVRDGYRCCWCLKDGNQLLLQTHPLSPSRPETRRVPQEAEVVGQVVGIVMRLSAR